MGLVHAINAVNRVIPCHSPASQNPQTNWIATG